MALTIVFETHSTSVDNERGIASGWLDPELSEAGRQQALILGQRRLAEHIDVVFTSDLRRAAETAQRAFGDTPIRIAADWRLRECNYGDLNGTSRTAIDRVQPQHIDLPFPNGESYRDVVARVRDFLADTARDWPNASIVLIGHSATHWALGHLLLGSRLELVVSASTKWQPGWRYILE